MKTIVALYDDLNEARQVVEDLVNNGVDREDISLMAGDPHGNYANELAVPESGVNEAADGAAVGAVGGAVVGGLGGILLGLGALAIPGLGPVIAAGPIVAGLVGAGIGAAAGGLVGALVGWGVPEEEAAYYTEGVRRGATLVSVRSPDMMVDLVTDILDRHQPVNIQERAASWRETGWTGSGEQPSAAPTASTGTSGSTMGTTATGSFIGDSRSGSGMAVSEGGTSMDAMAADSGTGSHETGRTMSTGLSGSSMGATGVGEADGDYESHYNQTYAHTGRPYRDYKAAYHYGYLLCLDDRYQGRSWEEVEPEVRTNWENRYKDMGAWEDFKEAVRHAWTSMTGPSTTGFDQADETDAFEVGYDEDYYRNHYNTIYASSGRDFSYYDPVYRFGHNAAMDERYYDRDWDEVEPELRQRWETEYPGQSLWEDIKAGVRHAWDSVTDIFEDDYDEDYYRNHYNSYYAHTGRGFDYYDSAYRYGYTTAMDDRYYGRDWDEIEPDLRQHWEIEHRDQGLWEDIKDAVRHAWESITDAVVPSYDEDYYRRHYHSYYSTTGRDYDYYDPAYRYGYSAAADDRYYGRDWDEVEPELRQGWETEHPGAWEDFKDAVRHAWDSVTDAFDTDYDEDYYRNHYSTTYATSGHDFNYYEPAYYYGYTVANTPSYTGRDWDEIEPEVRAQWETEHHDTGAWEEFKDAVRHAWKHVTGQPHTHY